MNVYYDQIIAINSRKPRGQAGCERGGGERADIQRGEFDANTMNVGEPLGEQLCSRTRVVFDANRFREY